MRSRRKVSILALTLLCVFLLTACPSKTNIGKILDNPDRYRDKEVGIMGTVEDGYGVPLVGGAYKVDDGTGEIWVVSRRNGGSPRKGARVGVKGRVLQGFSFGGRNFGTVIEESDRRSK
ncbi:MAG TPA: hypothetical protein VER76_12850 [Pyrinomonadaceae bacterium]|nr:hypothetical protein [Pyrinomonadaceae bacterium]